MAPGVLGNDSDADTAAASLDAVAPTAASPRHGVADADGSFGYDPDDDFNGTDTFTYRVSDGPNQSVPATVTVQVASEADAPVAVGDSYSVAEDGLLTVVLRRGCWPTTTTSTAARSLPRWWTGVAHGYARR